ncbi:MAG: hypothetical protein PUP91_25345, partial [Rhizonema sp. PD37]|nr:hypothetical protein [Rhizonema sp. PD37]
SCNNSSMPGYSLLKSSLVDQRGGFCCFCLYIHTFKFIIIVEIRHSNGHLSIPFEMRLLCVTTQSIINTEKDRDVW